ncbi:DUF4255 domain-containing protein [Microvirga pakistanensis]|uniref:DUF4255 domain-containing protein n=1 Tax=Microvirga pakistanensis TaxID=1682650 RepID=UPI00106970A1|nr:DUF4255 domain-containing protein [Microvirga pakistanensis]
MAGVGAVHSVGESIVRYLSDAYQLQRQIEAGLPAEQRVLQDCSFTQLSSTELANNFSPDGNQVTLYLYRVGIDKLLRTAADSRTPGISRSRPLSLELHYLLTAWSRAVATEQTMMTWAMRELHAAPSLDRGRLVHASFWRPDETIQVSPSELSHEDMMRIWDAVTPSYRLSTSYVARVVRIENPVPPTAGPVVAHRFDIREERSLVDG